MFKCIIYLMLYKIRNFFKNLVSSKPRIIVGLNSKTVISSALIFAFLFCGPYLSNRCSRGS